MPYVRGYYRRSAGGGGGALTAPKRLTVDIYGADGVTLLRDRNSARYNLESLQFDTMLPGGYMSASFVLRRFVSGIWPGRAGLRVVIRRGVKILWMGWIEDIQRKQRGRIEEISVACLGPWQVLQQRLISFMYTGTVYGQTALALNLLDAPEISDNDDYLTATGVNIADLAYNHNEFTNLVKYICAAGNSSGQQMLFAIWEPERHIIPDSNVKNPQFEIWNNPTVVTVAPEHWTFVSPVGAPYTWTTSAYQAHSGFLSVKCDPPSSGTFYLKQADIPCAESTAYTVDFWAYGAAGSTPVWFKIYWKTASGGAISNVTGTSNNPGAAWTNYTEVVTSPAGAALFDIFFYTTVNTQEIYIDDVYVYPAMKLDTRPVAHLWARDLSTADYLLHTAQLDEALQVDTTTRKLVNYVVAGHSSTWLDPYEDAISQEAYRQRDIVVDVSEDATPTVAAAMGTTYLAKYKDPLVEPGSFRLKGPGAVTTAHGGRVWPEDLRAGDRVKIVDGPHAGEIVLLQQVSYADGVVTCTAEAKSNVPFLLAQAAKAEPKEMKRWTWW